MDLAQDYRCAAEVVATTQAFLDTRASALPRLARLRREARRANVESQDDFSFGIDFTAVDLVALGGQADVQDDPTEKLDQDFAKVHQIYLKSIQTD